MNDNIAYVIKGEKMFRKLLCKIGIHKYKFSFVIYKNTRYSVRQWNCIYCKKESQKLNKIDLEWVRKNLERI